MARISGKLTAKALGWDRNAIGAAVKRVPQDTGRVFLGRIGGIVNGLHQTVNDDTGEVQTGLKGSFRGISSMNEQAPDGDKKDAQGLPVLVDTGKAITVTAGRVYLPGGLQEMVESAYAGATAGDSNGKNTVNFTIDLFAVPATNKAGYSYDADTVQEASESDPLDMLFASAGSAKPMPNATPQAITDQSDTSGGEPLPPADENPVVEPTTKSGNAKGK